MRDRAWAGLAALLAERGGKPAAGQRPRARTGFDHEQAVTEIAHLVPQGCDPSAEGAAD